jgi:ribosomal-protein-alanine N-acetyltransferase
LVLACEELAGIVELDSISAGVEAGALLAYSVDGEFEGRGLASEAVAAVVHFAFDDLHLEQLVAHFHPQNERSRKLLERAGFAIQPAAPEVPLSVHAPRPRRAIALLRSPASQGPTK